MLIKGGLCRPVTFLFVYKTNLRCSTIQSNMLEYSDYFFVINSSKIISVQKMCCFVTFINKRKSRLYAAVFVRSFSGPRTMQVFLHQWGKHYFTIELYWTTLETWKQWLGSSVSLHRLLPCGQDPDRPTRKPMNRWMNVALENNCQVNKLIQV